MCTAVEGRERGRRRARNPADNICSSIAIEKDVHANWHSLACSSYIRRDHGYAISEARLDMKC